MNQSGRPDGNHDTHPAITLGLLQNHFPSERGCSELDRGYKLTSGSSLHILEPEEVLADPLASAVGQTCLQFHGRL